MTYLRKLHTLNTRTLVIVLGLAVALGAVSVSSAARRYSHQLITEATRTAISGNDARPVKNAVAAVIPPTVILAEAQQGETLATATSAIPRQNSPLATIYDTTHASNQGAEITAASNGPATSMGDIIVLGGTNRFITQISVDMFVLASTTPFNLTMSLYTDCSTNGAGNSPCGNGTGVLIPGSTVTVSSITPPALGAIFTVNFPYPSLDISSEADNTISVVINASRSDVFWRIGETPTVGSQPAGDPASSFVTRCGSVAANNGCQRNFGLTNNFAITIAADATGGCTFTCPSNVMVNAATGVCNAVVNYTPPTGANCTITCTPPSGSTFNTGVTTVTCSNTGGTPSCSFTVTVNDNQPPTVTCPANISGVPPGVVTYTTPTANDNCTGATVTCSPPSGSTFAAGTTTVTCTATDAVALTGSCTFTVTTVAACSITCPANVTQANDANQCGAVVNYPAPTTTGSCSTVICSPPSGSFFPVGTTTVTCTEGNTLAGSGRSAQRMAVGGGGISCGFTVTVQDTQAPTITCPANQSVNGSGPTVVNYTVPTPSDNCPGATVSCVPPSGSSFVVGTTTVTCTASDTSPNSSDATCTFTVTVTPPCTITCPGPQFGGWTMGSSVDGLAYPQPTTTGTCGTVTCNPPSGGSFPVGTTTVTCSTTAGPSCSFTILVSPFPVTNSLADPLACAGPGDKVNGSFSATNGGSFSGTFSVTAALSNVVGLPGTATANQPGTVTITANSVNWTGTLAAGQSVTVNWMGQLADNVAAGAQACSTVTATANSFPVGGPPQTACVTVNCPPVGPGGIFPPSSEAGDQKAGSVLIYNVYTSGATSGNTQNTRINITNTHLSRPAFVHLFFVAEGCAIADSYICLTGNQTASFLASDLDPGTTGYLVAIAVNEIGCPTSHNYLIGDEYVKFTTGHAANLGAIAFSQLAGGLLLCDGNSNTATLNFDGIGYNRTPATLALDNVGSRADGNDTLLILNRIGGNLGIGASSLGTLFGIFYDDAENALSFSVTGGCQLRNSITNNFPRITPRFETFVPAGRTGWAKIYNQTGAIGITGAAINFTPNASSSAGAFNQGHNLHHLTLNNSMSYIIPVFPPSC